MSGYSVDFGIKHHQPLFGYGGIHPCGLAHDCHIDVGQQRDRRFNSVTPADLLLA